MEVAAKIEVLEVDSVLEEVTDICVELSEEAIDDDGTSVLEDDEINCDEELTVELAPMVDENEKLVWLDDDTSEADVVGIDTGLLDNGVLDSWVLDA